MKKKMLREPTGPGEILLEEFLVPYELSQGAFARHIGWPQPKVNEIITGKRGISPETAMVFSDAFGTTPEFWLNLQNAVDLWRVEQKHKVVARLVAPRKLVFQNSSVADIRAFRAR